MEHHLALVTGATSGIGKALCRLLANHKVNLIISGRSEERLTQLQNELNSKVKIMSVKSDLASEEGRQKLIQILHEQSPDLIINNAGFGAYGEALTYPIHEQELILEVNGKAVLELTLEGARALISKGKKGVILNVSSAASFLPFPNLAVYAATKAFVNHFSRSLDYEFRPHNVRVLAACPGMVDTDFQKNAGADQPANKPLFVMTAEEVADSIWRQIQTQKPLKIINWKYRFLIALSKVWPKSWLTSGMSRDIQARIKPRKIISIQK